MPAEMIRKAPSILGPGPNLTDYRRSRLEFSWPAARARLAGLPGRRGLNIAHEAVDRNAAERPNGEAIRFIRKNGGVLSRTYDQLRRDSSRFAGVLRALGVRRGERVFSLLGRVPQLHVAALGALKAGAIFCPLFSAFGPEPVRSRLQLGGARVLITESELYRRKVADLRPSLPDLEHVLLVDGGSWDASILGFDSLMGEASDRFVIPDTSPEDPALLHFTSGTTGRPKGALHVHEAVVAHHVTGALALDLHPDDVFWCTADPGWVTGTSYGIISPLTHGATLIVDEAEFDPQRWYGILEREGVSVWYTAPTAVRMMMKAGPDPLKGRSFPRLRFVASVGEPLHAEGVLWGVDALGRPVHDNWWQTETGGIMIANYAAVDVKPGSMGLPLPGIDAAVARRREDGSLDFVDDPSLSGELALRRGWPSMFRAYLNDEERYRRCFSGEWYLTGDLVRRDEDGYYWFVGRADDLIKSAGHLIGPFEVEAVLLEHPAVAEAGVIGKPDPVVHEAVKAFVSVKRGFEAGDALRRELMAHARKRLGPSVAPREIEFVDSLPRTRSGKIMRRLLRSRELGLPEGDTSTLEAAP